MRLMKAVFRGKFIALHAYTLEKKNSKIYDQSFHISKLKPK